MIDKVLPLFVYPLGLAIVLCLIALALTRSKWQRLAQVLLAISVSGLWVASTPLAATWITKLLEEPYPAPSLEDALVMDVAVILGGSIAQERLTQTELGSSGDRLFQAHRLWREGKVSTILVSGGNQPWDSATYSEANLVGRSLIALGVPPESIVLEGASRNTRENAVNVERLWQELDFETGYLVTSASHMARAESAFRKVGLNLTPWPADYSGGNLMVASVLDLLPDAGALERSTAAIKEILGLAIYRWRDWI